LERIALWMTYAVLGHNGAGKTTLIREILGFGNKRNSAIEYRTETQTIQKVKLHMSFSPEKYELLEDLTVYEYLQFVAKLYKQYNDQVLMKMEELLEYFELEDKRNKFIFTLSNGMKKKLCHISALAVETDFVFLDEPFAALDPVSIYHLKKYIVDHSGSRGFIICTHQLDIIDKMEFQEDTLEIILLNQGELKFKGDKKSLFESTSKHSIEEAYIDYHKR